MSHLITYVLKNKKVYFVELFNYKQTILPLGYQGFGTGVIVLH